MPHVLLFIVVALLMLLVGYLAGRKQDQEGFNIYNRRLGKLGYMVSYAATFIGAGFFIAGTAYAYRFGIGLAWFFIGMVFGVIIFGYFAGWLKKLTAREPMYNLPDFFAWRFGSKAAQVLTIIVLVLLAGDISIQLIGGGKLLSSLGVLSYSQSVVLTAVVVSIYLVLSGFRAVVWTDYVLLSAIIVLTAVLAIFSAHNLQVTPEQQDLFSMPPGTIIGFFLYGLFGPFTMSTYYQRIFAAESPQTARTATWLSALTILIPGLGLFILGMHAKNLFPSIDPDSAFLRLIQLGGSTTSLAGALVLWAALMSTVDTLTFAGSQILNKDLLNKPLTRTNVGMGIVIVLALALIVAFVLPSLNSVFMIFLAGGMTIAPAGFFQWFVPGIRQSSVIASLVAGIALSALYVGCIGLSPNVAAVAFAGSTVFLFAFHLGTGALERLTSRSGGHN
jgi:solute:Na+ symporter, SSS family